ncbi:putative PurR-regulated permease PerM [Geothermobacter ehrlichii]|uniref:Putative PurR-regulated permease PerM n=1 Tax=Geothermobacter ehrlichii TaxID=213224 RepID=A0A5D3WIV3_9BACT|nr:AI-2E family transporter [Geothermobacter ehrlichii]TYO98162.1 putative PurR-regulated permease PerM [Geothermobacter ehrlichii]
MTIQGKDGRALWMLAGLAAFVVVVAGLREASALIIPFLLAVFIAVVCAPPVFWLAKRRVPTPVAVLLVVLFIWLLGGSFAALFGTSLNEFTSSLPDYQSRLQHEFTSLLAWLEQHGLKAHTSTLREQIDPGAAMRLASRMLTSFGGILTNAFLIMVTVIFILLEAASFPGKLQRAFGNTEKTLNAFGEFARGLNRYLAIKSLLSLMTGGLVWLALTLFGVDFPLLWGLLAFMLNYVPTIGSIVAAVPGVLLTLVQYGGARALAVAAVYVALNIGIGSMLEPKVMGRGVGLSTLVVFVSLVFWGWVFGPIGMLLSVPLTMTLKIALEASENTRWLAVLLGPEVVAEQKGE